MLPATMCCPGTRIPEGSFPVSLKFGWHGGTHLHAPSVGQATLPVRCVADGEIVYARRPTPYNNDATHSQNYNPYGSSPSWTDNGMVIIRHVTDIGTGPNAKQVVFYSLITHLSELAGNFVKVANGTATEGQRQVSRKEQIGIAGRIYGAADHIHIEIVCDDANLNRLVGRHTGGICLTVNGRQDAVYGEIYFTLPIGTNFYRDRPADNAITPSGAVTHTTTETIVVGVRYCNGNGDHPGDAYVTSYFLNGSSIGDASLREPDAEYDLFQRVTSIKTAHENANSGAALTLSALYELHRFGRTIGPDPLNPSTTPHWRRANHPSGAGWVNLNSPGIFKYSDADFPDWKGWRLIDDDVDDDSRCNSSLLTGLIKASGSDNKKPGRAELEARMSLATIQTAVAGAIAKFPSEWNRDTIDKRWSWLQTDAEYRLDGADWAVFREHISALTVPSCDLPETLRTSHWHFHPQRFIEHLRTCSWLSEAEMAQTLPKYMFYNQSGNPRTAITNSSDLGLTRAQATARFARHHVQLNQCIRRYIGPSRQRTAIFLAQVTLETAQWRDLGGTRRLMHEWGFGQASTANPATVYYSAFYGRGIMQLTWAGLYKQYGAFRGLPNHTGPYVERLTPTSPRITTQSRHYAAHPNDHGELFTWSPRFDPDIVGEDPYAACDSGGYYWVSKHFSGHININRVSDQEFSPASVGTVNRLVNGGGNGYYERQAYAAFLVRVLTEDTSVDTVRQITLPAPRGNISVNFSRT
jgi:hypothetical protein